MKISIVTVSYNSADTIADAMESVARQKRVIAVGVGVLELVGWLVGRKASRRFGKMSPEERFKYQNEMRKAQM